MELQYLDFEASDEADGRAGFDAMASVAVARLPALLAEVDAVLGWSERHFGRPAPLDEGGEWDFDLQAQAEPGGAALPLHRAPGSGAWQLAPGVPDPARCTLTLTLVGGPGYGQSFREAFQLS